MIADRFRESDFTVVELFCVADLCVPEKTTQNPNKCFDQHHTVHRHIILIVQQYLCSLWRKRSVYDSTILVSIIIIGVYVWETVTQSGACSDFFSFFSPQQVDRRVKVLFGKPYGWKNKTRWRPRIVVWSKETRGYFLETIFRVTDSPDVSEFNRWQTVTIYAHPASPCVCLSIPSLIKRLMRIKYSGIISVPSRDR